MNRKTTIINISIFILIILSSILLYNAGQWKAFGVHFEYLLGNIELQNEEHFEFTTFFVSFFPSYQLFLFLFVQILLLVPILKNIKSNYKYWILFNCLVYCVLLALKTIIQPKYLPFGPPVHWWVLVRNLVEINYYFYVITGVLSLISALILFYLHSSEKTEETDRSRL